MTDGAEGTLVACHECDRLHLRTALPAGARADCGRCGAMLYRHVPDSLGRTLALHLTALVLLLISVSFPFLGMKIAGLREENHLFTGAWALVELGMWELGVVVFLTSVAFPFAVVLGMLWLLIPLRFGATPPAMGPVFRMVRALDPWALVGVFLLGALIAIVKLQSLATVLPGVALYAFMAALVTITAARASFDPDALWAALPLRSPRPEEVAGGARLLACHACALVMPALPAAGSSAGAGSAGGDSAGGDGGIVRAGVDPHGSCPRCGAALHLRKADSLTRTWALVLSAALLMIPAQILPVMTVTQLGRGSPDTILSGVTRLIENGLFGLAAIVFFASIVVPVAKLLALVFLLRSVQKRSAWRPRDRTLLYRVTELIGAWSMVDVFLVGLLSGLVSLNLLATIEPGIGASYFGAVVILTMFAARSFDPRLIWDHAVRGESGGDDARGAAARPAGGGANPAAVLP